MQRCEGTPFVVREASAADVAAMFDVRTSVVDNATTVQRLEAAGVTPAAVAASFANTCKGWVAEWAGQVIGFSIADKASGSVFALFVRPDNERQGAGGKLLELAVRWLRDRRVDPIWLTTSANSRAAAFYIRRGWRHVRTEPNGESRFELAGTDVE